MIDSEKLSFLILHSTTFRATVDSQMKNLSTLSELENLAITHSTKTTIDTKTGNLQSPKQLILYDVVFDQKYLVELNKNNNMELLIREDTTKKYPLGFCIFDKYFKKNTPSEPGVYCWVFGEQLVYIGETDNLRRRINNYSQAGKSQSTNRKMNNAILDAVLKGKDVTLYFYKTKHNRDVEQVLLRELLSNNFTPKYNKRK